MNEEIRTAKNKIHNVIMESRRHLLISGVIDVTEFNENEILLITEMGELSVRGQALCINKFEKGSGELDIDGEVSELVYLEAELEKKGLFARLMR
ncbi:MAG: sporulation protein YabP [Oscillospiraceae bacterium]|jgi:sporulation protein YabP|nr:sporulation protein YabP [Oscillospiraceae bacterium]